MPTSGDEKVQTWVRLGSSSLEDWPSFLENCPLGETHPISALSRLDFILLSIHLAPGLVVLSICWLLLVLALVSGSILLILWGMPAWGSTASSTAALHWASDWDGWTARRQFCSPYLLCDGLSRTLPEDPSLSESGMLVKG